ncbi:hypothetical protein DOS84_09860 [Flavobacterium aquariorum]|uniref:Uncharacterized protein n=1 Tax=Flavobacterium aquariorum TaxID=2217670 RepID=A0A2W7TY11_9FLAO|nr:hypothetical protein DOS84_09860 [Flavobacterium aquariorum]
MNKNILFPVLISVAQIISFGYLYYINKHGNSHIPIALIESTILSLFNILLLIGIYFFVYKPQQVLDLWIIPVCLSILLIIIVVIVYSKMFINKYN